MLNLSFWKGIRNQNIVVVLSHKLEWEDHKNKHQDMADGRAHALAAPKEPKRNKNLRPKQRPKGHSLHYSNCTPTPVYYQACLSHHTVAMVADVKGNLFSTV